MSDDTTSHAWRTVPRRQWGMSVRQKYLARLAALAFTVAAVTGGFVTDAIHSQPTSGNTDVTAGAAYAYY
ncbi:hypothetical protein P3T35_001385 [Kitasatospora sp. GP30]|nr:hypothetical protein [Kitasatospora sp. GP30]